MEEFTLGFRVLFGTILTALEDLEFPFLGVSLLTVWFGFFLIKFSVWIFKLFVHKEE